ncbi:fumarylacetoacetate hydrolase family protein [Mycetohabitans rhizoxinica]|uniref:Fumarylacetoacetate hydrolase family protein n=1 Tax=Mycetohabitans rhizoxinica TaxID=412963 RepID=A0ABZ2PTU4_9BURK
MELNVAVGARIPGSVKVGTVYGVLLNFRGVLQALGDAVNQPPYQRPPQAPVLYIKPANTLAGDGDKVQVPHDDAGACAVAVDSLEIGASLGIVFARRTTRVKERDALDAVLGFTVVNDVSVPHSSLYRPAVRFNARDGFCPLGPVIVPTGHVGTPNALDITVRINGQVRQQANTRDAIRGVARLIEEVSAFMSFERGDVLLLGVPPHAPRAQPGDAVEIEIERIGVLHNGFVREATT